MSYIYRITSYLHYKFESRGIYVFNYTSPKVSSHNGITAASRYIKIMLALIIYIERNFKKFFVYIVLNFDTIFICYIFLYSYSLYF